MEIAGFKGFLDSIIQTFGAGFSVGKTVMTCILQASRHPPAATWSPSWPTQTLCKKCK